MLINGQRDPPQRDTPDVANQWPGNPDSKTDSAHRLVDPVRLRPGQHRQGDQADHGRPGSPTADIDSPSWYKYVDPTKGGKLQVKGIAPSAWGSEGLEWTLEWAPAPIPPMMISGAFNRQGRQVRCARHARPEGHPGLLRQAAPAET